MWWHRRKTSAGHDAATELANVVESRRAIVAAYEVERRRIERDLHDGTQQYLVAAAMKIGEAKVIIPPDQPEVADLIDQAHASIRAALTSLRATVRGIHPQVLVDQGLEAAVTEVISHLDLDVELRCPHRLPDLPEGVLAAAYFFITEALNNVVKYAPQASVSILIAAGAELTVSVVDTGPGGAQFSPGHGLAGMRERLAAVGGQLSISSPPGGPTQVRACIPLLLHQGEPGVAL